MPKERTHWMLALQARDRLPSGKLKELLKKKEAAYLFGAVAPDSVFFPGLQSPRQEGLIHYFHGRGNNDIFGFWRIAAEQGWLADDERLAFLFGLTSHLVSDAVFHPLVHYFSGWTGHVDRNIARRASSRHFRLEVLLDLFLGRRFAYDPGQVSLRSLLERVDIPRLAETTGILFYPGDPPELPLMEKLFDKHAFYQARYDRIDYRILSHLLRFLMISLRGRRDLFYRSPLRPLREKTLIYRHPVTGEPGSSTWAYTAEEAVLQTIEAMQEIERCIDRNNPESIPSGPHPDMGIASDTAVSEELRYCSPVRPEGLF